MPTLVHLKRSVLNTEGEIVEESKKMLLNLTAGLAIRLKAVGANIFASLDSEETRNWITSIIQDRESLVNIAHVVWPDPEIDEWLTADSLDNLREAFLIELQNFSYQSSPKTLQSLIVESRSTLAVMDKELSDRIPEAMDILRKKALSDIPEGENLAKALLEDYEQYQRGKLGGSYSKP